MTTHNVIKSDRYFRKRLIVQNSFFMIFNNNPYGHCYKEQQFCLNIIAQLNVI